MLNGKTTTSYRARWRDETGVQRSQSFARKADAERHVTSMEAAINEGRWIAVNDTTTVAEYAAKWLAARPHRPSTARSMGRMMAHITGQPIGATRLSRVRPSDVQGWATDRAQHLAPSTMRLLIGLFRSVMSSALADGLIPRNPVGRVAVPTTKRAAKAMAMTAPQVAALAALMPAHVRSAVTVAAGTGLRCGELLGLTWDRVNLDAGTIAVTEQLDRETLEPAELKTPGSERVIPLARVIIAALRAHRDAYPSDRYVWHDNGAPVSHTSYEGWFRRAAERSGVSGARPHTCRHTYASVLLAAGVDVVTVAARLGHADPSMTLSIYAHMIPAARDKSAGAVDDAFGAMAA